MYLIKHSSFKSLLPYSFHFFLVVILVVGIYSEYFLGKYFSTALVGSLTAITFLIFLLKKWAFFIPQIPTFLFVSFVLWTMIITPFSVDITSSMWETVHVVNLFLLFLLSFNLSKEKHRFAFAILFLFLSIPIIFIDVALYVLQGDLGLRSLTGIFSWHNQMAGFLLFVIPVIISQLLLTSRRLMQIFLFFSLGLTTVGMVMTFSRGGWVLLFIQLLALMFIHSRNKIKALGYFLIVFFAILGSLYILKPGIIIDNLTSLFSEITNDRTVSGNFRISTWKSGIDIIESYPLIGVGPGTFGSVFASFQNEPWLFAQNAHNHILQVTAETGIIGGIIYSLLLVISLVALCKSILKISQKNRVLLVGFSVSIVGVLLHSLIDYDLSTISLSSIFFTFLGYSLGVTKIKQSKILLVKMKKLVYVYLSIFLFFIMILEISEDRYMNAKYSLENGNIDRAIRDIQLSLLFNPFNGKSYILASDTFYRMQLYPHSEWYAKRSIEQLPFENLNYTILGAIAAEENDYESAINWYNKSTHVKPYASPNQYIGLAYSYEKTGKIEKAESILDYAVENIFPINQTYKEFEYVYFANGLTNDLAALYIYLGNIKLSLGKTEEANLLFLTAKKELIIPQNFIQTDLSDMVE